MRPPVFALLCGLVVGGCYAPSYPYGDGELRCDLGVCPPGFRCLADGHCHGGLSGTPDGATSATSDAGPVGGQADGPSGAVCSGSQTSCASPTQPEHCVGGQWVVDSPCGADTPVCDNGTCGGACVAPASRCRDPRTLETCNASGFWEAQPTCTFACLDATATCGGECIPFSDECRNGNELWECGRDGAWALKQTCGIVCDSGSCGGDCSTGDTRCNPTTKVPQTCASGHWQDQAPCAYACLPSGSCAPQCDPAGAPTCIAGDAYACGADGNWTLHEQCTASCSAGTCTGSCADGTKQCSGVGNQTPETCTGGMWVDGTPCEFVCSGGDCVVAECHPNVDKKCEGGFPYRCDATGHYVKGGACMFVCDGDQCGGICSPGSFRCNGSINREKCSADGKSWTLDQACPYGCSGTTCNACTPDPNTCQNKCGQVTNNCGTTVSCGDSCAQSNGPNWVCDGTSHTCSCTRDVAGDCAGRCGTITDRCGFSVSCSAAGNGGVACNGTGQVCLGNGSCCTQEAIGVTCSGDPGDDCGTTVADNCGVNVSCSTACDAGFTCGGNPSAPHKCTCNPGAVRCTGSVAQTCNASGTAWGSDMTCSIACIDGAGCGSCAPGTTACCDATHVKTCGANGTYGSCSACAANAPACRQNEKSCGGVCAPGAEQCGTDGTGNPAVLKCDAEGQWTIVVQTCAFTCTGGSTSPACTGECHPGDTICSDPTTLKTCGANFMYTSSPCPNGCGNGTCCTESDASMCPGTGGATCGLAVTKPSCGVQLICGTACTNNLQCGGNAATPNQCSCSPNSRRCAADVGAGGTALVCDASGTVVTATGCSSGCTGGSCCLSDASYCHGSLRRYCTPQPYCNRTAQCTDDCATQFPTMPSCGIVNPGQCGCTPSDQVCNDDFCDSDGVFHSGPGCASGQCCCRGEICAPEQGCMHGGGECG